MLRFVCAACDNVQYVPEGTRVFVCKCGKVGRSFVTDVSYNSNPWVTIHSRYAAAIESGQWDREQEEFWLHTTFARMVPANCDCESAWKPLAEQLDLSSAEAAFHSLWQAHNRVSTEHVKPPLEPISFDRCRALYLQQPSLDDCCVAVTSLSPRRHERQTECLNTWKRAGLRILAVQTTAEIAEMREQYPQVSTWCVDSEPGPPRISRLAGLAVTLQKTVMLINSDIEIRGEQRIIREALAAGSLVGVRYNYDRVWWQSEMEQWGIDVFSFSPEIAAALPALDLRIGRPMWDYWIPQHLKEQGAKAAWIKEPLFFHRSHALNWTQADWQAGADVFTKHYGFENVNWQHYRKRLEQ